MNNRFSRFVFDLPRWAFCLLLILTPWAWGGIPTWVEVPWSRLCLGIVAAYFLFGLLRRTLSFPPIFLLLPALWILGEGWWMVKNALYQAVPQYHGFWVLVPYHRGWPGSFDEAASQRMMWKVSALLGALFLVCDLARTNGWRKMLILAFLLAGGSVACFGLIMRIQSQAGIWPDIDKNNYPFGTFYYHGNAAAYLNTVLPIALACLLRSLFTETGPLLTAILVCVLLLVVSAAIVCASKAGMVIAVFLIIIMGLSYWWLFSGRFDQTTFNVPPFFLWVVIFGVAAIFVVFIGQQAIVHRWQYAWSIGESVMAGRRQTAQMCLAEVPEAGWWGFGPGTFASIFPAIARQQHVVLTGVWLDAHEDYLQTLLEWGKSGAIAWGIIFFGSTIQAVANRRFWFDLRRYDRVLMMGILLSLVGCAVHSLVDYPLQVTAIELNMTVVMGLLWSSPYWDLHRKSRRRRSSDSDSAIKKETA